MRRLIQIAVLLLLLIHLGGAPFETVDHWDQAAQGGDDLVFSVLSLIVGLSLTLLVGWFLRLILKRSPLSSLLGLVSLSQIVASFLAAARPAPLTSPPLPLRI